MSYKFEVESGNTVKFPVGGKYCDRDIEVTATGGDIVPEPTTISGIDLHDRETDIPNTYIRGANIYPYNGWTLTDFIPLEDGKFYIAYSTSNIDPQYCSKFNANKEGARAITFIPSTNKNRPTIIPGDGGYFRFSGKDAQINALEFYEVINFNWEGW
jgi:hypothetical protein